MIRGSNNNVPGGASAGIRSPRGRRFDMLQRGFFKGRYARALRSWAAVPVRSVLRLWRREGSPVHSGSKLGRQELAVIENAKAFCVLPWKTLFVHTGGQVRPCCMFDGSLRGPDGAPLNVNTNTMDEIWNSKQMG